MPIGIDADEILFPFLPHFCRFINGKYKLNLSEENFHNYRFWEHYPVSMQQSIDDVDEFCQTPEFRRIAPFDGAVEGIKQLRNLDSLAIASSRKDIYQQHTETQADYYFPGKFSAVLLGNSFGSGKTKTKRQICEEKNIWLMIEDSRSAAIQLAKDIPVIVPAKPWNVGLSGRNIIRVPYDWNIIIKVAQELYTNPYCLAD